MYSIVIRMSQSVYSDSTGVICSVTSLCIFSIYVTSDYEFMTKSIKEVFILGFADGVTWWAVYCVNNYGDTVEYH
jgi:hypothetical protein